IFPLRCSRLRDSISNDSSTPPLMIPTRLSSEWVTFTSMTFGIKTPPAGALDGAHPRIVAGRDRCGRARHGATVTHPTGPRAAGAAQTHRAAAGSAVSADGNSGGRL